MKQPKPSLNIQAADVMGRLPKQFFATLVHNVNREISAGHDVINLGQGNPDRPTPEHIVQAAKEAVSNPLYHKYSPFTGYSFLKEAAAQRYLEDYGVTLDPEKEVAILFGGKTGLVQISQILLNPGDLCLVPDPGYPDYWSGVALAGAEMSFLPLREENNFLPDYEAVSAVDKARAKLMFLNYPNNPTSATAPLSFYEDTVNFAAENNIVVASDFAYGAIGFDGHRPVSFLEAPGAKEVGIEYYTLSKTYNMAGWRVAFAVGNENIISLINQLQDHIYVSLFGAVQEAAQVALTSSQQSVADLVAVYESRRNALFGALDEIGWKARKPGGSFFAWLPVPEGYDSARFAQLILEQAKVAVAPGIGFGKHGEGFVRVGLLSSEDRLREAVHRIGRLSLF
ncbi:pyridoxal phosphate-dependent aminotransferase [Paenibacillus sp. YPG26]|uniref:pyridoxal phosphate-dependent aminotransferase n=1 Tax=Paenibacillus sp. YPG26 TaxID=2878915 RepID=UPI00203ED555|nr:pyridoxal phosphate-dependent aminotransferase [Paenibacillus sp. YPG26]USB34821.1 pyridoxal phosphate-dependent aminotransferase [Paenibacillus sp. YPG26]